MRQLYVVDYIGISSGMRYYHIALEEQLRQIDGLRIEFLSNYRNAEDKEPFFPVIFKGSTPEKVWNLIRVFCRLKRFIRRHRNDVFVFMCFGSLIDILLIPSVLKARNSILDIHDPIMKGKESSNFYSDCLARIYGKTRTIIYHSDKALKTVQDLGFAGETIYVPHFSYTIQEDFHIENVAEDVTSCIAEGQCNVLYFGNINYSKGPDIFIDSINSLGENAEALNFIMAGKISDASIKDKDTSALHTVFRTVNDDELKYLFSHADYMVLPYRETYQSGVLEMAFKFRVPTVVSDVPYFRSVLETYPSFGILTGIDGNALKMTLLSLSENGRGDFYKQEDLDKYNDRKEFTSFRKQLQKYLESC